MRFKFGKNWKKYSKLITNERIKDASNSLKEFFEVENFDNKSFIDVGCGSGIFSISACLLGAKVKSFDFDTDSVECTQDLSKKILGKSISIEKGDILDSVYVKKLGEFDYVYSWGVIHHSQNPKKIFQNIFNKLHKDGKFFFMVYNKMSLRYYCLGLYYLFFKFKIIAGYNLDTVQKFFTDGYYHKHYTSSELIEILNNVGFKNIKIEIDYMAARVFPGVKKGSSLDIYLKKKFGWFLIVRCNK